MSFLQAIPLIGDLFKGTKELISEAIVDKDKANSIIGSLDHLEQTINKEIYVKELETKTLTWVDALHKMGRQITNYLTLLVVGFLLWKGHIFTQWDVILLTGGNVAYQVIKGKGK
jgi:hypothetical protein